MEPTAHLTQTFIGVDHGSFRGGEALTGGKRPVEVVRVDAHHQTLTGVATLGLNEVVAAVHKGKSPCIAGGFGGVGMAQRHRRVVGVAGDAPHTANALDAAAQRRTF